MTDMNPFPPPDRHTDAIRDLQERFQLLERNLSERINEMLRSVDNFIRTYKARPRVPDNYDYSQGSYEE